MFSAVTLVLWLGARAVLDGTMTGGDLAKFLSYAIFMGTSVARARGDVGRAAARRRRDGAHRRAAGSRPSIVVPDRPRGR